MPCRPFRFTSLRTQQRAWCVKRLLEKTIFTRHPHPPHPQPQQRSGQYLRLRTLAKCKRLERSSKLTVKITLTLLRDAAATLLLILLKDLDLLESLHDLAINAAGGLDVVGGARATVLGAAVYAAEAADTNGLAEVDVTSDGSGTDVEPVDVLGRHLLGGAGLDGVNPTGDGELALTLQESGVGAYSESAICRTAHQTYRGKTKQSKTYRRTCGP